MLSGNHLSVHKRRLVNEIVGNFLLELYHRQIISPHNKWNVLKTIVRGELMLYLKNLQNDEDYRKVENTFKNTNIGTLLRHGNYLFDTPPESAEFRINNISLFQYRKQKYENYEEECKNANTMAASAEEMLVNENAESFPLTYNGSLIKERRSNDFQFEPNISCYICMLTFETPEDLKVHTKGHGVASDFELLKLMPKQPTSILKLYYNHCKNPRYFRFTLESLLPNIIIEKIIIMQLDSMHHIEDPGLPYQLVQNCKLIFLVDSLIFPLYLEQAIAIVLRDTNNPGTRLVEQHHFICTKIFTLNKTGINPHRLPNMPKFQEEFPLPQYLPNATVRLAMKKKINVDDLCKMADEFKDYITNGNMLTALNISKTLYLMLQIEDIKAVKELCDLIQRHVKLEQSGREYTLTFRKVHEFNENILVPNNDVFIIPETPVTKSLKMDFFMDFLLKDANEYIITNKKIEKTFYGQVNNITDDKLTFVCDEKISLVKSYIIVFRPVRQPIRYQYRALELLNAMPQMDIERFLFPEYKRIKQTRATDVPTTSLKLQNKDILNNPEHLQAVQHITGNTPKYAPYIIFGPPGTGKTTILVESILQLYLHQPNAKILVTAGPNSACDEITLRLCKVLSTMSPNPRGIARIYSRSQEKLLNGGGKCNKLLLQYSNLYAKHFYPDINVLHEYRIVICTLSAVGKLCTGRFGKDKNDASVYTHIFVDESAAISEAETLVGIVTTLSSQAQLILSGDPKQLGPIIKAEDAKKFGLGISLMERLLERDCYAVDEQDNYDRSSQIRLYRNYRSHPEIVKLYNNLFYNNKLTAMLTNDANVTSLCEKWHRTQTSKYPILFHSVYGTCVRKNRSWYNVKEVEFVMDYVNDLMSCNLNGKPISQDDIGIISPYKKQYQRIRSKLNDLGWTQIETGAAETFRGKEKPIIIVSFVRSFTSSIVFINESKRLNVILSRPKSLLILIGNRKTLNSSQSFRYIIDECKRNNSIIEEKCNEQIEAAATAAALNSNKKKKRARTAVTIKTLSNALAKTLTLGAAATENQNVDVSPSTSKKSQQANSNASSKNVTSAKAPEAKK